MNRTKLVNMIGSGSGILKPEKVNMLPVDKAIRTSGHIGSINTNPPKGDCLGKIDKNGNVTWY